MLCCKRREVPRRSPVATGARHIYPNQGHVAQHVRDLGFKQADDATLWRHARDNDLVVVSKEEDFHFLASSPGNTGKLLWVRIGNCRTKALLEVFGTPMQRVVAAFDSGALVVEIR